MTRAIPIFVLLALALTACPQKPKAIPGGNVKGDVIGSNFDGTPLTVGKGELEGKPLVITWFATW